MTQWGPGASTCLTLQEDVTQVVQGPQCWKPHPIVLCLPYITSTSASPALAYFVTLTNRSSPVTAHSGTQSSRPEGQRQRLHVSGLLSSFRQENRHAERNSFQILLFQDQVAP